LLLVSDDIGQRRAQPQFAKLYFDLNLSDARHAE
jgi:hypothetical protein